MKKLISMLMVCLALFLPIVTNAADVKVTAFVPSKVSEDLSRVETNLNVLPADGVTTVIITVTLKYKDGTIAAGRDITIASNRGRVDAFQVYKDGIWADGDTGKTDNDGIIRFTAKSTAPGRATFVAIADSVVLKDKPSVSFTPLPILERLLITVTLPFGQRLTILKPPVLKELPGNRLVDSGIELEFPFWLFIAIFLILISSPLLFTWLLLIYHRLRLALKRNEDQNKKEQELLGQIYELEQKVAQMQETDLIETAKIEKKEDEILEKIDKE